MTWLWNRSGIIGMFLVFAIIIWRDIQQAGLWSASFFFTVGVCGAVAAISLTWRWRRERRRLCHGG